MEKVASRWGAVAWEALLPLCARHAAQRGVAADVHPDDHLFRFQLQRDVFADLESAVAYYFSDGARSAQRLGALVSDVCRFEGASFQMLEFASGYGCVTRHLANALPEARVTSCDIHAQAIAFLQQKLGVDAVASTRDPRDFDLGRRFDLVFALSFFSHMPQATWRGWLGALLEHTRPGGFLIFTTHGRVSQSVIGAPRVGADGFFFLARSEQEDLDPADYGITITLPGYVERQLSGLRDARRVGFVEGAWWEHQDLWILQRSEAPAAPRG